MMTTFYQQPFPTLTFSAEYILREQTMDDTENFFRYYTDHDVGQYILATKPVTLLDASREVQYCRNLFYTKQGVYWAIAKKNNNEMIGAVGLYVNAMHQRAEITYDLAKEYWRRGIMLKALRAVMKYALEEMKLLRIEAVTRVDNKASIALLKKAGFQHEGTLKNYRYYDKRAWDVEMYAITQ